MRRMPWAMYLWPGLPQLWQSGFVTALALATGFAILLNLLLLASFVWVELLNTWQLRMGWLAIGSLWAASAIISAWHGVDEKPSDEVTSAEGLFREALNEYLQRSWFEAEQVLGRLLNCYPRDVEARLLLATLLRVTRRYEEALSELARLVLLRDAEKWCLEIAAEKRLIAAGQASDPAAGVLQADEGPGQSLSHQAAWAPAVCDTPGD